MATKPFIAEKGLMLQTLGSFGTLAVVAPLVEGSRSEAAMTDHSRIGRYYDRTPGSESEVMVCMGKRTMSTGSRGLMSLRNEALNGAGDRNEFYGQDVGNAAGTGTGNFAMGQWSLQNWTTGGANTALGIRALADLTTGNLNTAIGASTLQRVTSANHNVGVGYHVLDYNVTGEGNVGMGSWALEVATGDQNVAVGRRAGDNVTTGARNTLLGAFTAQAITTGSYNTAVGTQALANIVTGRSNIGLGRLAGLGKGDTSNTLFIGYYVGGGADAIDTIWVSSSDARGPQWQTPNRFLASSTLTAGVSLGVGADPGSPFDGDMWATASGYFGRVGGITRQLDRFSGSLALNQVAYGAGTNVIAGSSSLTWTGTTFAIGVSPVDSGITFLANRNATAPSDLSGMTTHPFIFVGADGERCRVMLDSYGSNSPILTFRSASGTAAAPSATASGATLANISVQGYGATVRPGDTKAFIQAAATALWTDSSQPFRVSLQTAAAGSSGVTTVVRQRWYDDGGIQLGGVPGMSGSSPGAGVTYVSGLLRTIASAALTAGFNLAHGVAPTPPGNGDLWTTMSGLYAHIAGFTVGPYIAGNQTITLSGDATGSGTTSIAVTLASTITAGGPTGSSSVVPVITYDAKGRLTTVTTATITPGAIGAVATGRKVDTQYSLTGGGDLSTDRTLNLVNDVAAPGNSKLYGTDVTGVRGWYAIPTGFVNPMSAVGDLMYGGTAGAAQRLAGNTTIVKNFLTQTGDGTNSAAPGWGTISSADVSGLTAWATKAYPADAAGLLRNNGSGTLSWDTAAYITGNQTITLSGDVTGSGTTAITTAIAAAAVTLTKMADLAANSVIGNNTALAATPVALSQAQLTAMVNTFTALLPGTVPASGGGTTNFLRADGNWSVAGTGTVTGTGVANQVTTWSGTSSITGDARWTLDWSAIKMEDFNVGTHTGTGSYQVRNTQATTTGDLNNNSFTLVNNSLTVQPPVLSGGASYTGHALAIGTGSGYTSLLGNNNLTASSISASVSTGALSGTIVNYLTGLKVRTSVANLAASGTQLATRVYGIYGEAFTLTSPVATTTVTDYYALYLTGASIVGNGVITNNYGVYQADATAKNVFVGRVQTSASTTARAGFNVAPGAAPTSAVAGDMWITTAGLYGRINSYTMLVGQKRWHGIESYTDATFNNASKVVTFPACTYWYHGVRCVCASNITVDLTAVIASGGANKIYYVYFPDASGVLVASATPWGLKTEVPVITVYWNGSAGAVTREYHGYTRDLDWHTNAHLTIGARYQSGLALSGLGGTGTGATWTFSSGTIWDEDLTANLLGGNQTTPGARVFYQVSGSAFTFADTAYPFIWNSGTSLVRAPAVGTFTLTDVASNRYINVWVYASNDPDRPFYFFTPAQTVFTSTANARAVGPPDLSLFGLTPEIKLLYRIVYRGDGVAQTAVAADDYRNSSVLPAGGTPATSASSVTFTPTGNYTATNVQAALAEIDVLAVHNAGPETITGRKTFSDTIMAGASVALAASINIASGVAPTTPADGDIWLTTAGLAARYNSTTVQVSAQVQKRTIRLRGQVMASVVLGAQSINVASPVTGTIVGWRIITDVATAASLEVWKKAGGVPTSGDIITASAPATISGVAYVASTTMTSWNTAVAVGDVFELNVASNTAAKVINLELDIVVD